MGMAEEASAYAGFCASSLKTSVAKSAGKFLKWSNGRLALAGVPAHNYIVWLSFTG